MDERTATLRRFEVVVRVDDEEVLRHGCQSKDAASAGEFAIRVWMLGRDMTPYRGKTVTAIPTEIEAENASTPTDGNP